MSFVFDGHSDMWCNITMRRLAGERNVFKNIICRTCRREMWVR